MERAVWASGSPGVGAVKLPSIAQRPHQPVVRLNVFRIHGNRGAKGLCRFGSLSGGQQVEPPLRERFSTDLSGLVHVLLG